MALAPFLMRPVLGREAPVRKRGALGRSPNEDERGPAELVRGRGELGRFPNELVRGRGELGRSPNELVRGRGELGRSPNEPVRGRGELGRSPNELVRGRGELGRSPNELERGPAERGPTGLSPGVRVRNVGAADLGGRGGAPSRDGARRTGALRGADGSRSAFLIIGIAVRLGRSIGPASPAGFARSAGLSVTGASPLLFVRSVGRAAAGRVVEVLDAAGRGEKTRPTGVRPEDGLPEADRGPTGRPPSELRDDVDRALEDRVEDARGEVGRAEDLVPSLRGPLRGAVGMMLCFSCSAIRHSTLHHLSPDVPEMHVQIVLDRVRCRSLLPQLPRREEMLLLRDWLTPWLPRLLHRP